MEVITIFQDYKSNISFYKDYFEEIISIKKIIGDQNCILEANGDICIKNYIGTFSTKSICLQVLPKIYNSEQLEKNEAHESLSIVYRLLEWSNYLRIKVLNARRSIDKSSTLLEVLIYIFISEFLTLHRKSVYREYKSVEEDQLFIKGKVIFQKSINYNPSRQLYKRVQYDEFSINNQINRILKTIIKALLYHSNDSRNLRLIRLSLSYLEDVNTIHINQNTFIDVHFNRMNQEYKPLIMMAEMLSNNQRPGFSSGERQMLSFTLQLNILFEYFIKGVLERIYQNDQFVKYQEGGYLAKNIQGTWCFHLKPDFRILDNNKKTIMVLDTKFKNPVDSSGKISIATSDLYQMCTYALRFSCKEIILIYPLFKGANIVKDNSYFIEHGTAILRISTIQIDLFKEELKKIEDDLRMKILKMTEHSVNKNIQL